MHTPMTRSSSIVSHIGVFSGKPDVVVVFQILGTVDRPQMTRQGKATEWMKVCLKITYSDGDYDS